ncbi:MAG: hypothetical protein JXJ04_10155 [Spirochaetales bacterium]|nr:hypothetical protein [Spirochaetales bacterium]
MSYITGYLETAGQKVPVVSANLSAEDYLGSLKVRLAFSRNNYRVEPGLYAFGSPDDKSPVLLSANYKLSFDYLRKDLDGLHVWILVLDSKGINVWCAAGKGTFGTDEVVRQINLTHLEKIVSHREVIAPQLGAPGISAHVVKEKCGFKVTYGPVRACDIKSFLKNGKKATTEMRRVTFTMSDRARLIGAEVLNGFKYFLLALSVLFIILFFSGAQFPGPRYVILINIILMYFAGTVFAPLFLPFIPGRAFALKGAIAGALFFIPAYFLGITGPGVLSHIGWFLIMTAVPSFIFMNFTGASTFTSLSGVKKEMRYAVRLQALALIGSMAIAVFLFLQ